jgi:hypothetical protein
MSQNIQPISDDGTHIETKSSGFSKSFYLKIIIITGKSC